MTWVLKGFFCYYFYQGFKEDIDALQEELDMVRNQGTELLNACGEPDKPVIKKNLDEVIIHSLNHLHKDFSCSFG